MRWSNALSTTAELKYPKNYKIFTFRKIMALLNVAFWLALIGRIHVSLRKQHDCTSKKCTIRVTHQFGTHLMKLRMAISSFGDPSRPENGGIIASNV